MYVIDGLDIGRGVKSLRKNLFPWCRRQPDDLFPAPKGLTCGAKQDAKSLERMFLPAAYTTETSLL